MKARNDIVRAMSLVDSFPEHFFKFVKENEMSQDEALLVLTNAIANVIAMGNTEENMEMFTEYMRGALLSQGLIEGTEGEKEYVEKIKSILES